MYRTQTRTTPSTKSFTSSGKVIGTKSILCTRKSDVQRHYYIQNWAQLFPLFSCFFSVLIDNPIEPIEPHGHWFHWWQKTFEVIFIFEWYCLLFFFFISVQFVYFQWLKTWIFQNSIYRVMKVAKFLFLFLWQEKITYSLNVLTHTNHASVYTQ